MSTSGCHFDLRDAGKGWGGGGGDPLKKARKGYAAPGGKGFERFWSEKKARTLPISVWNRVWFSRELRVCMKVFTVSIPFLRTLFTLCQAKTAKRGKATREDFIA